MPQHTAITADHAVDILNELLALDPVALTALVERRWACNEALADHPTCQVVKNPQGLSVGLLGVLNALFGADDEGRGQLCIVNDADGSITKFARITARDGKHVTIDEPVYCPDAEELAERLIEAEAILYPNLNDALIGTVQRFGMDTVALYDREKCIEILMGDGMSHEEAEEWFGHNTLGTWAGDGTPCFATLGTPALPIGSPSETDGAR